MGSKFLWLFSLLALGAAVAAVAVTSASGSVLIARGASHVNLEVIRDHGVLKALLEFDQNGQRRDVLAWGAINARPHPTCGKLHGPMCGPPQVEMQHMRLSPTGHVAQQILRLPNLCKPYDGPKLPYYVVGCEAPDHTYWGVQSWVRLGPVCTPANRGLPELRLSHWSGPVAQLHIYFDWLTPHPHVSDPAHYQHLFGWYTYKGKPVFGLNWSGIGVPLDGYGRVIYIQSHGTDCGNGDGWDHDEDGMSLPWHGVFCHSYSPPGTKHFLSTGDMYRAIAMGPGVTPDVGWGPVAATPVFDPDWEHQAYSILTKLSAGAKFCRPRPFVGPWLHVNEVLTGANAAPHDEFVEILNNGNLTAHIGGYQLVYRSATDTSDTVLATVPAGATLGVGQYYVFAGSGYSFSRAPNQTFFSDLSSTAGGVGLRDDHGNLLDSMGYGPGVTNGFVEGNAASAPPVVAPPGESISRIPNATDTNDNSADFKVTPPTPGGVNHTPPANSVWAGLAAAWRHLTL